MRSDLAARLRDVGENPITHKDPEPMHLNIARLLRPADVEWITRLLANPIPVATENAIHLHVVELVVTDFLLSPDVLRILDRFALGPAR
jgi:hypothetical protein